MAALEPSALYLGVINYFRGTAVYPIDNL